MPAAGQAWPEPTVGGAVAAAASDVAAASDAEASDAELLRGCAWEAPWPSASTASLRPWRHARHSAGGRLASHGGGGGGGGGVSGAPRSAASQRRSSQRQEESYIIDSVPICDVELLRPLADETESVDDQAADGQAPLTSSGSRCRRAAFAAFTVSALALASRSALLSRGRPAIGAGKDERSAAVQHLSEQCWNVGDRIKVVPGSRYADQEVGLCGFVATRTCAGAGYEEFKFDDGNSNWYEFEDLELCGGELAGGQPHANSTGWSLRQQNASCAHLVNIVINHSTIERDVSACADRCMSSSSCVGFAYQAGRCSDVNNDDPGQCVMISQEECTTVDSECTNLYELTTAPEEASRPSQPARLSSPPHTPAPSLATEESQLPSPASEASAGTPAPPPPTPPPQQAGAAPAGAPAPAPEVETALAAPASAGDTAVTLADESLFGVGDEITFSSAKHSETREVVSKGSVMLNEPLSNSYPAGSKVARVPPAPNSSWPLWLLAGLAVSCLCCFVATKLRNPRPELIRKVFHRFDFDNDGIMDKAGLLHIARNLPHDPFHGTEEEFDDFTRPLIGGHKVDLHMFEQLANDKVSRHECVLQLTNEDLRHLLKVEIKLTREEMASVVLRRFDFNRDDILDEVELLILARSLPNNPFGGTDEEWLDVFHRLAADAPVDLQVLRRLMDKGDDARQGRFSLMLSDDELRQMIDADIDMQRRDMVWAVFRMFDLNGDNILDKQELLLFTRSMPVDPFNGSSADWDATYPDLVSSKVVDLALFRELVGFHNDGHNSASLFMTDDDLRQMMTTEVGMRRPDLVRAIFERFDVDRDHALSRDEFLSFVRSLPHKRHSRPEDEWGRAFDEHLGPSGSMDLRAFKRLVDGDGTQNSAFFLADEDLRKLLGNDSPISRAQLVADLFAELDSNGDQSLDGEELRALARLRSLRLDWREEWPAVCGKGDGCGSIRLEEFTSLLNRLHGHWYLTDADIKDALEALRAPKRQNAIATFERTPGKILGLELSPKQPTDATREFMVAQIYPHGIVGEWNQKLPPDQRVRRNDHVVMVNGVMGDAVRMRSELTSQDSKLRVEFARDRIVGLRDAPGEVGSLTTCNVCRRPLADGDTVATWLQRTAGAAVLKAGCSDCVRSRKVVPTPPERLVAVADEASMTIQVVGAQNLPQLPKRSKEGPTNVFVELQVNLKRTPDWRGLVSEGMESKNRPSRTAAVKGSASPQFQEIFRLVSPEWKDEDKGFAGVGPVAFAVMQENGKKAEQIGNAVLLPENLAPNGDVSLLLPVLVAETSKTTPPSPSPTLTVKVNWTGKDPAATVRK